MADVLGKIVPPYYPGVARDDGAARNARGKSLILIGPVRVGDGFLCFGVLRAVTLGRATGVYTRAGIAQEGCWRRPRLPMLAPLNSYYAVPSERPPNMGKIN